MDNIFGVVAEASNQLRRAGMSREATALGQRVWDCQSYDEAMELVGMYLDQIPEPSEADADAEWDEYWAEQDAERLAV